MRLGAIGVRRHCSRFSLNDRCVWVHGETEKLGGCSGCAWSTRLNYHSTLFVERLLCKQTALLPHLTSGSPGLVEASSPEAASESLGLHCWMNSRQIKRIIQLNFNQGTKVSVSILRLAAVSQTGIRNSVNYSTVVLQRKPRGHRVNVIVPQVFKFSSLSLSDRGGMWLEEGKNM